MPTDNPLVVRLTAIGDAIRERTGGTDIIPLVDMPEAIRGISGGLDDTTVSFHAQNAQVAAYLAAASAAYTDANRANFYEETISELVFSGASLPRYHNKNAIYSTSYRPYYYISAYRASQAGQAAGCPHYVGVSLYNSTSSTTSTLKRDIEVELLEYTNCTVVMLDEMVQQGAFYSAANYSAISNTDAYTNGTRMTGDSNNIDRLFYASFQPLAGAAVYGSQLLLSADGVSWYSICNSRATGTTKTCTTQGFRAEHIAYNSGGGTIAGGSRCATSTFYEALPFDFRYSWNPKTTLTAHKPVYLKCTRESGLYYLDTTGWVTQTAPTSEDGYYYILIGYAYSTTNVYLKPAHPAYKFVNGSFHTVEYADAYELIAGLADGAY